MTNTNENQETVSLCSQKIAEFEKIIESQTEQLTEKTKEIKKLKSSVAELVNMVILCVNSGNLDKEVKPFNSNVSN